MTAGKAGFASPRPLGGPTIRAAAVYCSDGRFAPHFEAFLEHTLEGDLCDRLAVPGGPACLREAPALPEDSQGGREQLAFLVRAHRVERVILIAHEPCAFYRERLGVPDDTQGPRQARDLGEAVRFVTTLAPLQVDLFTAQLVEGGVRVRPVTP
jgi:hypothetical protein